MRSSHCIVWNKSLHTRYISLNHSSSFEHLDHWFGLFVCFFIFCCFFLYICHLFCFVLFICARGGVRELTLLFSHLQRQRNTKKVLPSSYHTLLSGLRPYSLPYLSGDRYAPRHLLQPHGTHRQVAQRHPCPLHPCTQTPKPTQHRNNRDPQKNTFNRCTEGINVDLLLELSARMNCVTNNVSLMLICDHCVAGSPPLPPSLPFTCLHLCLLSSNSSPPPPAVHSLVASSCLPLSFPLFPLCLFYAIHPPSVLRKAEVPCRFVLQVMSCACLLMGIYCWVDLRRWIHKLFSMNLKRKPG